MLRADGMLIILRDGVLGRAKNLSTNHSINNCSDSSSDPTLPAFTSTSIPTSPFVPNSVLVSNSDSKNDLELAASAVSPARYINMNCDTVSCEAIEYASAAVSFSTSDCASTSTSTSLPIQITEVGTDDFVIMSMTEKETSTSASLPLSLPLTPLHITTTMMEIKINDVAEVIEVKEGLKEGTEMKSSSSPTSASLLNTPCWPLGFRLNLKAKTLPVPASHRDENKNCKETENYNDEKIDEVSHTTKTIRLSCWEIKIEFEEREDIEITSDGRRNISINPLVPTAGNQVDLKSNDENKNKNQNEITKSNIRILQSVTDIFPGQFHYYLSLPSYCSELVVLSDKVESSAILSKELSGQLKQTTDRVKGKDTNEESENNDKTSITISADQEQEQDQDQEQEQLDEELQLQEERREEIILEAPALSGIDMRLKTGLPLLVPIVFKDDMTLLESNEKMLDTGGNRTFLRLEYIFKGANSHEEEDDATNA